MKISFLLLTIYIFFCSCSTNNSQEIVININTAIKHQTIHNFGASDAWSMQFVGKNWPNKKKDSIAQWLFSKEVDNDGNPKGIGLTCWRFNIGGGSSFQSNDEGIKDIWRRAGCFIKEGEFNINAQEGQRWFLKEAKKYGVEKFVGFVNSPPVAFTENGKAYSSNGIRSNLPRNKYDDFANFLADVYHVINDIDKVKLDYLSPINEPQWDWKKGQEGSPWKNNEIADFCKVLDSIMSIRNVDAKIEITEAGKINYLTSNGDKPKRGNQIYEFWNKESQNYLGDLKHIAHKIAAHSYFSTFPDSVLISDRHEIKQTFLNYPNIEYWMSEYCLLENNKTINGKKRDLGIHAALYMAKVIHADLVESNASAWHWWLAVSPYNYKDGLIYIDKDTLNGSIYDSKMLWALGNYSRFIKPGSKRIEIDIIKGGDKIGYDQGLLLSAYTKDEEIVLVAINQSLELKKVIWQDLRTISNMYVTNEEKDLQKTVPEKKDVLELLPNSVTTFIISKK